MDSVLVCLSHLIYFETVESIVMNFGENVRPLQVPLHGISGPIKLSLAGRHPIHVKGDVFLLLEDGCVEYQMKT